MSGLCPDESLIISKFNKKIIKKHNNTLKRKNDEMLEALDALESLQHKRGHALIITEAIHF